MDWLPIETAPKDGTWVDLWCVPRLEASPGRMANMSWSAGAWRLPSFLSNGAAGQAIDMDATHWMALPPAPGAALPSDSRTGRTGPASGRNSACYPPTDVQSAPLRDLLDTDGENRAVRAFLLFYGDACGVTVSAMRSHMRSSGFPLWPAWVGDVDGHLTKSGAQDWLRHLFGLESSAIPQASTWAGDNPKPIPEGGNPMCEGSTHP